jgi:diadenosine tetraphosphate (Ap4A) HIT family hydrolase
MIFEDDRCLAFHDVSPLVPMRILVGAKRGPGQSISLIHGD